jgi:arsenate reductase-like glutaredoxin family protein
MADDRTPITPEKLKDVLDKLNEVLGEAARLRKEVMRQLSDQRASDQQLLNLARKRQRAARKRR